MMFVNCSFVNAEGKTMIKVDVRRGTKRPYFLRGKGIRPEGVYVRQAPSTDPASYDAIRQMIIETSGGDFEKGVSFVQDLTLNAASSYFAQKQVAFESAQMQTLGLINKDKLYTNLALLLSDQCQHSIKAAVFQGTRKTIFRDRAEFSGSIFRQLEDAYGFIMKHNNIRSTYNGLDRIDTLDFPAEAVREGLLNAVVHRDYGCSGPIIISIFDDRLELLNPGGLLPNMTVAEVLRGISVQRNKELAAIFYPLRLIEAYGTGYDKIDASYDGSGKTGQISVTANSFCLTLPNRNALGAKTSASKANPIELQSRWSESDRKHVEEIVDLCRAKNLITRKDVQQRLGISQTAAIVLLKKMMDNRVLERLRKGRFVQYSLVH